LVSAWALLPAIGLAVTLDFVAIYWMRTLSRRGILAGYDGIYKDGCGIGLVARMSVRDIRRRLASARIDRTASYRVARTPWVSSPEARRRIPLTFPPLAQRASMIVHADAKLLLNSTPVRAAPISVN
jgi:hypothetical protein